MWQKRAQGVYGEILRKIIASHRSPLTHDAVEREITFYNKRIHKRITRKEILYLPKREVFDVYLDDFITANRSFLFGLPELMNWSWSCHFMCDDHTRYAVSVLYSLEPLVEEKDKEKRFPSEIAYEIASWLPIIFSGPHGCLRRYPGTTMYTVQ